MMETFSVIGGVQHLATEVQRIKDAPTIIQTLKEDLEFVQRSLSSFQALTQAEQDSLGKDVIQTLEATVESCSEACNKFHATLRQWTKHSGDDGLSLKDRLKIGWFKEDQVRSISKELRTCKMTLTYVVLVANLNGSLQSEKNMEPVLGKMPYAKQQMISFTKVKTKEEDDIQSQLERLRVNAQDDDDLEDDRINAIRQIETELSGVQSSQAVMEKLVSLVEATIANGVKSDSSANINFGEQHEGFQTGMNNWPSGGISLGKGPGNAMDEFDTTPHIARIKELLSKSTTVISQCNQHGQNVKFAGSDLERVRDEVLHVQIVARTARDTLEGAHGTKIKDPNKLLFAIGVGRSRLQELHEKLRPKTAMNAESYPAFHSSLLPLLDKDMDSIILGLQDCTQKMSSTFEDGQAPTSLTLDQRVVLDRLPVAEEASFDSYSERHNPTCLPNTRAELLQRIQEWADSPESKPILWLHGPAGTGKSTVARTVAQSLAKTGSLGASFFFKKGEVDCRGTHKFWTTIAADLALKRPAIALHMKNALHLDPAITTSTTSDLSWPSYTLIHQPLSAYAWHAKNIGNTVIVIDGLDECEMNGVAIISGLLRPTLPDNGIKVLLTSRLKLRIHSQLEKDGVRYQECNLQEVPWLHLERDITASVQHEVAKVRDEYNASAPPERRISSDSPVPPEIQDILNVSDPNFLIAAFVCRLVLDGRFNGLQKQLRHKASNRPATLGRIYAIFLDRIVLGLPSWRHAEFLSDFQQIVGAISVAAMPLSISSLSQMLDTTEEKIEDMLNRLRPICSVPSTASSPIRYIHSSFRSLPFSEDQEQEGGLLWINEKKAHAMIASSCLRLLSNSLRYDMCNLIAPQTARIVASSSEIKSRLTPAVQYACLNWAFHVRKAKIYLHDQDETHSFLLQHFLHWIEALSLLDAASRSMEMVAALRGCIPPSNSMNISVFLGNAFQFLLHKQSIISKMPLQAYYSPPGFAPHRSILRKMLGNDNAGCTTLVTEPYEEQECLMTLEGHAGLLTSVAFSHDSTLLVSTSYNGTCRTWRANTGQCLQEIGGYYSWVTAAQFSHDSSFVVSSLGNGVVRIWHMGNSECTGHLGGHRAWVSTVIFSHDSTWIASGSADRTVRIWVTTTGECLQVLRGHQDWVSSLSFSHDSKLIASGSSDCTVRIWNTSTAALVQVLEHGSWVSSVSSVMFSKDSELLVTASGDLIRLWVPDTGRCIRELKGHTLCVSSAVFSPDSALIASGAGDGTVRLWRVDTGENVRVFRGHGEAVNSVAFSHDSSVVASASDDGTIKIWPADYKDRAATTAADMDGQSEISDIGSLSTIASFASDDADHIGAARGSYHTLEEAARTLADHLFGDAAVRTLYLDCFQKNGATRFSLLHDDLVRIFMKDMRQAVTEANMDLAAKLLGRRQSRTLTTAHIVRLLRTELKQSQDNDRPIQTQADQQQDGNDSSSGLVLPQHGFPSLDILQDILDELEYRDDEEGNDEETYNQTIHLNKSDVDSLIDFMTTGTPFQNFKYNLTCFTNPPTTLSAALSRRNILAVRRLLREQFDSVAQGEYSWLRELEEIGQTRDEIADLLLEDATDSPWIYFTPAPIPRSNVEVLLQHHVPGCVHQLPWLHRPPDTQMDEPVVALGELSGVLEEIQRLCGLAGITPSSRELQDWNGSVVFEENNSMALISYKHPDTSRILTRVTNSLQLLCSAVGRAQLAGLCCESFTILIASQEERGDPIVEVCRIEVGLLLEMLAEIKRSGKARDDTNADLSAAMKLLNDLFPKVEWQHVQGASDIPIYLHLYSLSAQVLSLGFQSYIQAHVGPFHPFFLDTAVERGTILGCYTAVEQPACIGFEMKDLTCVGEMLQDRVLVFRGIPGAIEIPKASGSLGQSGFDLLASAEDLIDTWGPGKFIVPTSNHSLPSAVRIGGGIISCGHPDSDRFHWSRDTRPEEFCQGELDPQVKIRIGSLVTVNSDCKLDEEQFRARCAGFLRPLGTYESGFILAEKQFGLQAGQYVVIQANAAYRRYPGRTLKQFRLEQRDEELLPFLEENWAVKVSLCTGIARRVPLREMVADLLPVFANNLTSIHECANWERLSVEHDILEAFRGYNLKQWLRQLEQPLYDLVLQITRRILQLLSETGLDRNGRSFVISWPYGSDTYQGFYVDLRQKESSWTQIIADSEDSATFAYVSPSCLETTDVRCRGVHRSWRNAVPLLETTVLTCPTEELDAEAHVRRLNHKDTCFFRKLGNLHFVRVDKPDTARFAKLVQMSNNIPPRIKQRLFNRAQLRLRERNGVQEGGEKVALLALQG